MSKPLPVQQEQTLLKSLIQQQVHVLTNDGRILVGKLHGVDQTTNMILGDCQERVFSKTEGVQHVPLGLFLVRGECVYANKLFSFSYCFSAMVSCLDEELEGALNWDALQADPLPPIVH